MNDIENIIPPKSPSASRRAYQIYKNGFIAGANDDNSCPHAVGTSEWEWWHEGHHDGTIATH